MPNFLTVKAAAALVGKSPSSIRRIIYPITKNDKHRDRLHVQPTVEEVKKLRMKGDNFAWRVDEEFLRRAVPVEAEHSKESGAAPSRPGTHGDEPLLAMLRAELQIKNDQIRQQSELIAKQMELFSGLSERLREGNILIGGLQQRIALTDGRPNVETESAKPERQDASQPEKGSAATPKTPKPKPGFWEWLSARQS